MLGVESRKDLRPWYKERWTWLLMLMPASAIVGGMITLWLAIKSFDGLVADDYYKQGLAINQTLAKGSKAREMGLVGLVKIKSDNLSVALKANANTVLPTKLILTLAHPTKSGSDQIFELTQVRGEFKSSIAAPLASAHWKVIIEDESHSWRLSGTAFLPAETEIRIDSSEFNPVD